MITGYMKFKHVTPGSLIRTRNGSYAVVSEYHSPRGDSRYFDSYLLETGEALHIDIDEWVAIIDLQAIEVEAVEEADYPDNPTQNFPGILVDLKD